MRDCYLQNFQVKSRLKVASLNKMVKDIGQLSNINEFADKVAAIKMFVLTKLLQKSKNTNA